jgi:signal peptidase I
MALASSELAVPMRSAPVWRRMWSRASDIVTSLFTVAVVIVTPLAVVAAIATHFSSRGQYTVFGHPTLTVLSGSMTPAIRTGDLIVDNPIGRAQAANLHRGQIITFHESAGSQNVITHRIVGVVHQSDGTVAYQTKGDANNMVDPTLRPAPTVVGVFRARLPKGGYILNALHRPLVLGLLLASPLLWFAAEPLRRWAREEEAPDPASAAGEAEGKRQ